LLVLTMSSDFAVCCLINSCFASDRCQRKLSGAGACAHSSVYKTCNQAKALVLPRHFTQSILLKSNDPGNKKALIGKTNQGS
jgi:hypothetical protein